MGTRHEAEEGGPDGLLTLGESVNGPPGLSLAELVDRSPPSSLGPEAILKVVIKSELRASSREAATKSYWQACRSQTFGST